MAHNELPIPSHFNPDTVGEVWKVAYQERAAEAAAWAKAHTISPTAQDMYRVCLLPVDVQNTFCIPNFELYVGGRTGSGAIDDNRRLCQFIYRNLGAITEICPTMDTHGAMQIFHSVFLINDQGEHPPAYSLISYDEIAQGVWKFNPALAQHLGVSPSEGQAYLEHYAQQVSGSSKYDLTIWPYHAMLGGIGHALVSAVEEAIFFHSIARYSQPDMQIKGNNPFTENYSVLNPEVITDANGQAVAEKNTTFTQKLMDFDAIIIGGQAKSHCVAWTIEDLLNEMLAVDETLVQKVYLLEDCSSPVVIPDVIDYTDAADAAYAKFAEAGMHVVRSTEPVGEWPGFGAG